MADDADQADDSWVNQPPPTDETGDVDLSLIWSTQAMTPAERIEHHYQARLFAEELRRAGDRFYGSPLPDIEELK